MHPRQTWFAQGPTNASLAGLALYSRKVPQFKALLAEEGGDLHRFYSRVRDLAKLPKDDRNRALAAAAGPTASSQAARP